MFNILEEKNDKSVFQKREVTLISLPLYNIYHLCHLSVKGVFCGPQGNRTLSLCLQNRNASRYHQQPIVPDIGFEPIQPIRSQVFETCVSAVSPIGLNLDRLAQPS